MKKFNVLIIKLFKLICVFFSYNGKRVLLAYQNTRAGNTGWRLCTPSCCSEQKKKTFKCILVLSMYALCINCVGHRKNPLFFLLNEIMDEIK